MKPFFSRHIDNPGRLVRGLGALLLAAGGAQTLLAGPAEFAVRNWDADTGLPQGEIRAVARTPDGSGFQTAVRWRSSTRSACPKPRVSGRC